jgi:hypothetical protein
MNVELKTHTHGSLPLSVVKKTVAKTPNPFAPEIVLSAYTFSWIDHKQLRKGDDLAENLKNIMRAVALVSALCLTIWMNLIFQPFAGRTDMDGDLVELWKTNTLVAILWIGAVLQAMSMVNCVFLSMLVEACDTTLECEEFIERVPNAARTPIILFYVAILTGILGMLWYFFVFFGMHVLYFQTGVMVTLALGVNAVYYQGNVAALKATLETSKANESLVFTKEQIKAKLDTYVAGAGFEYIDPGDFQKFLSRVEGGRLDLAFVTKRRASKAFERFLEKRMSSEGTEGTGF